MATTAPVATTLVARIYGRDFDLGEMTIDVPVSWDPNSANPVNVGDIKPALAAALRQAADSIETGEDGTNG